MFTFVDNYSAGKRKLVCVAKMANLLISLLMFFWQLLATPFLRMATVLSLLHMNLIRFLFQCPLHTSVLTTIG